MRTRNRIATYVAAVIGILYTAAASSAATLGEVEKNIIDRVSKHKTMQYKSTFTQDYQQESFSMKSTGKMTGEYKRKSKDRYLSRVEIKTQGTQKVQGQPERKTDGTSLIIQDEKLIYTYTVQGDQKTAMKMRVDPKTHVSPFDVRAIFKNQREHFTLKLLPDETVDGKPTYVIESTPKKADQNPGMGRMVNYYDKKTGINLKSVTYDPSGKATMTSITTDVKIDAAIPDDRFVFKAPAGVKVIDQTQQQKGQPAQRADRTTQDDDSKADAKEEKKPKEKKKKKNPLKSLFNKLK